MKNKIGNILNRKVSINRRTGQPSMTLPKKKMLKIFKKMPKEIEFEIKRVKW